MNDDVSVSADRFSTTRWSLVLLAGKEASPESAAALERLCRTYWRPVCMFARYKGWGEEDAKDLTQQFFASLLERRDFAGLDPRRGKFRTFLLAAFTHFMANAYDRENAQKRGGGKVISLEEASPDEVDDVAREGEGSPAVLYDLRWARAILQIAMTKLKAGMSEAGKGGQFEILKPFLTAGASATEYAAAAEKLGVDASSVPVMVHRIRQRYRELVRAEVAQTVTTPSELEEEMRHLFAVLNR